MTPMLVTTKEAAELLRISRNKVKNFLPAVKLSAHGTRYDIEDIKRLISDRKQGNTEP